jgi:hypothetical protein
MEDIVMRFLLVVAIAVAVAVAGTAAKAAGPDQTKPDQVKAKPDQTKAKPDQVKHVKPVQAKPDQAKPDQTKVVKAKPDQVKAVKHFKHVKHTWSLKSKVAKHKLFRHLHAKLHGYA